MKFFKSGSVATAVAICFFFVAVAFATQPAEARSYNAKAGISAPAKHKKAVKKTKKAKKAQKVKKAKNTKKSSVKTKRNFLSEDPSAQ